MTASKRRPQADGGANANSLRLHRQPSLEAAMDTWRWLHSNDLDSELVWHVLFEPFGLCYCVRCPTYMHGDQW